MSLSFASLFVFALGFIAQILFFARTFIQWFKSEKAGKVLSPVVFWQISLIASVMMLVYGILRKDAAIILGQILVYFIYIRNLQLQGAWKKLGRAFRFVGWIMPLVCFCWMIFSGKYNFQSIVKNENVPPVLMSFGVAAQLVFTFRFIYQWLTSEKKKESTLPLGFWYISITGSAMIVTYAILRRDPVLFLGHMGSMVMYLRNLLLHYTKKGIFDLLPFDMGVVKKYIKTPKNREKKHLHE
jgi:lipid-A-disaccharide synthase-like uncharacterized protein